MNLIMDEAEMQASLGQAGAKRQHPAAKLLGSSCLPTPPPSLGSPPRKGLAFCIGLFKLIQLVNQVQVGGSAHTLTHFLTSCGGGGAMKQASCSLQAVHPGQPETGVVLRIGLSFHPPELFSSAGSLRGISKEHQLHRPGPPGRGSSHDW